MNELETALGNLKRAAADARRVNASQDQTDEAVKAPLDPGTDAAQVGGQKILSGKLLR